MPDAVGCQSVMIAGHEGDTVIAASGMTTDTVRSGYDKVLPRAFNDTGGTEVRRKSTGPGPDQNAYRRHTFEGIRCGAR
jgi:hypothetical protein